MIVSTKGEQLKKYLQLVCKECEIFHYFHIRHVPRGKNQKADRLVKFASGKEELSLLEHTMIRMVNTPTIGAKASVTTLASVEWA